MIAVVHADDAYAVMRALDTNGDNYNISTELIIARLRAWDRRYGVQIDGIGFDWLSLELKRMPDSVSELAAEVYKFCPDAVDQGTFSLEALEEEIRKTRHISLWWD